MPDIKEKLALVICQATQKTNYRCDVNCGKEGKCAYCLVMVEQMIANGVTVGKPLIEHLHPIDAYAGLKEKYLVFKADTGEQVVNCFVLRPDKDTAAVEALRAYACSADNKTLSDDIYSWVGKGVTVRNNDQIPEVICDRIIQNQNNGEWLHQFRFKLGDRDWAVEKKLPAELVAACVLLQQWIPVTERLPDNKKCVLMYSPDGGVAEGVYEESRKRWVQWRWSVFDVPNVTHWMPLPEPPSEVTP